jgi:histidinol dehydrogenase
MRLNRDVGKINERKTDVNAEVVKTVQEILKDVKTRGDEALREYVLKFDGYAPAEKNWAVSPDEISAAVKNVGSDTIRILERAAERIKAYHVNQMQNSWSMYGDDGVLTGQIVRPLRRVGLYVPSGTAALPSTLLMNAVPAKLAGVKELAVFTPVKADGKVNDVILAAAFVCGIETIYKVGGAQAVAAAAFGTETIPKVDKIVGPGIIYVATAKRMVYGEVDIDMVAGPSEILIIADEKANPRYIAADMLSQAEHDVLASAVLVTTDEKIILQTEIELERQLKNLKRADIARASLENYGAAIKVKTLDEAFEISNEIAPEHLEILTENPIVHLPKVINAGSIFLGENTPEPLGDYMSGTNHVLPTGGTAKFYSPLGVQDFIKFSAYSYYPREALAELKDDVVQFAMMEGLDAHANAVKIRFNEM